MTTYLNTQFKTFSRILHVADIHIRMTKRHEEYREVFSKFYSEVNKTPEDTLVVIAGDLYHNKTDLNPETVDLAGDFLNTLANSRPTILFAGNHDATLNNKNRMDSLYPLVKFLNNKNLFYLRESGLYIIGDLLLNNYSIFDDYTQYLPACNIPKKLCNETSTKIALFHGPVQGAVTDVGYRVVSKTVSNESFDGHDIVLLGDIHKHQRLQEHSVNYNKPIIVYAGSMIRQNHGELLEGHGYVNWDVKNREYQQIDIPNDYGFFTVEIEKGKLYTDVSKMPKKVTLRAKCNQTIPSEVKSLMAKLSDKHQIIEISYDKTDSEKEEKRNIIDTTNINLINISTNVDYQNQLIKTYLLEKKPEVMTEILLDQICDINKDINSKLEKEFTVRNIRWKPKRFEFENMFSYGEGNIIDFTNMKGTVGLFASNASGKSSILSALSYCLFDKCDRTFKASNILNTQKMSFNCKFNFEIENVDYFIERKGQQDKKGNVKVNVRFYKINPETKEEIDLNGEARRDTNDVIRDYIGTYDDFLLTVLSIQNNSNGNFIDMGQADRKDLIAKFMGITIYDQLDTIAKSESKEIIALLKNYSKTDYPKLLEQKIQESEVFRKNIESEKIELEKIENKLKNENLILSNHTEKIINIGNAPTNILELEANKEKYTKEKNTATETNKLILDTLSLLRENIDSATKEFNNIDGEKLQTELQELNTLTLEKTEKDNFISKKEIELHSKIQTKEKLGVHNYDPNCKYCVESNKKHFTHVTQLNEEISQLTIKLNELKIAQNNLVEKIKRFSSTVEQYNKFKELESKIKTLELKQAKAVQDNLKYVNTILQLDRQIENTINSINLYNKEKDAIESNKINFEKIRQIKQNISTLESTVRSINQKVSELTGKLAVALEQKNQYEEQIKMAKVWELQQQAYTYYLMAISRDGIPYDLISKALPTIEAEINNILHQIVDFTVNLFTDGKNVIGYINYDGKKWPIEMGSGLERFALSLAIRVALITISNLPRPNFIAIDEGFGCADKENLAAMASLISCLKNTFDFVWVVSHLDAMKDMVDKQLEIKKERGFSKIVVV